MQASDGDVRDGTADASDDDRGRDAAVPWEIPWAGWRDVGLRVAQELRDDNVPVVAAGVAFYAWLALIPALVAVVLVASLVMSPSEVTQEIGQLTSGLSPETAGLIEDSVSDASSIGENGLGLGALLAILGVLWSASGGMDGLVKGINIAYDEDLRGFARRRGLSLLLSLGAIVASVVAIGLIAGYPVVVERLDPAPPLQFALATGRWVLLALLLVVGLAVLFRFAPHRADPRVRWLSVGAVVATVVWLLGSAGFAFYVNTLGSYSRSYGALAGVVVLNLWLFVTAFSILLGAEVNAELEAQTRRDTTTPPEQPMGERGAVKADNLGEVPDGIG